MEVYRKAQRKEDCDKGKEERALVKPEEKNAVTKLQE
jgi:hypothetical protein